MVEVEFVGEWEEYIHELGAREYLEEISRRAPREWEERLAGQVEPWDERFRAATVEKKTPHLAPLSGEACWVHYRTPRSWRRPSEDLGLL